MKDSVQEAIIEEFSIFDDWLDKYDYLISLSDTLPAMEQSLRTERHIIEGCQSRVWVAAELIDGKSTGCGEFGLSVYPASQPVYMELVRNGAVEKLASAGAIIRTANLAGAHGVIIPKNRAVGLTATVARTSAGALNYTPVAKVTNLSKTIEELKKEGMWFVCADMGGTSMYQLDLKGPMGLVIGNEGDGVSRLVREKCDFIASIPMKGDIDSLNASVAAGVLAYEIVRQRLQ